MNMKLTMAALVAVVSMLVLGCDPPPACDASLKHLTNVCNYPTNVFKQVIPANPALASNSAAIISRQIAHIGGTPYANVNYGDYSEPIYYVGSGQSKNTYIRLHLDGAPVYGGVTGAGPMRWRTCIAGTSGTDGQACVVDEVDGCVYEFWMLNKNIGIADPEAGGCNAMPFTDTNAVWDPLQGSGSTAGGALIYAFMVWPDECSTSVEHGFMFGAPWPVNNPSQISLPFYHCDGSGTHADDLFQGMRVQLNPGYDISGLPTYSRAVAQAMKTYGMYDGNSNGGTWNIYAATAQGYTNNPWTGVLPQSVIDAGKFATVPLAQFRVLEPTWTPLRIYRANNSCITYQGAPQAQLSGISPSSGASSGGTSVTLTGDSNIKYCNGVTFDGVPATNVVVLPDATSIACTTPAHAAATVNVTVSALAGPSTPVTFTYSGTPPPAPTLSAINPTSGTTAGGTACTLTGTNLTGCSAVSFGGTAATGISVVSSTQVRCTSPAKSAGAISVTGTTAGGTSNGVTYTYVAPPVSPTLSAINPTSGTTAGGTACTLTGANLTGCSAVSFGGTAATGIAVDSSTQVRCTSPAKSIGTYSVTATTANGTSNGVNFTYTDGTPTYTATLYAAADARVHSTSTAKNFGTETIMYVQKNASVENASYIKWDMNSVQGSTITSAKIRLYQSSTTACTNYVYSCADDSWVETAIKWSARPAWGTSQASFSVLASAGWREVDVTSYVSANFNGDKLVTVVIRDDANQNIQAAYHTKENTSNNKPALVVISQ